MLLPIGQGFYEGGSGGGLPTLTGFLINKHPHLKVTAAIWIFSSKYAFIFNSGIRKQLLDNSKTSQLPIQLHRWEGLQIPGLQNLSNNCLPTRDLGRGKITRKC